MEEKLNWVYCPTGDMIADMLMKGLNHYQLRNMMDQARVKSLDIWSRV